MIGVPLQCAPQGQQIKDSDTEQSHGAKGSAGIIILRSVQKKGRFVILGHSLVVSMVVLG